MAALLKLITLFCSQTEEGFSEDEPYITVNGKTVWSARMSNGEVADLSDVPEVEISESALITLFEKDIRIWDYDDFLGTAYAFSNMAGLGQQRATFTGDGASYELTFEVLTKPQPTPHVTPFMQTLIDEAEKLAGVPFVANDHKLELHRIDCRYVSKIEIENRYPKKGAMDGRNAVGYVLNGYNGCFYCLKQIHFK